MTSSLEKPEFLARLTADHRKLWETQAVPTIKDEVVVSPEKPANDVYFVLKGTFEVSTFSEKGKIVFYRTITPGDLFGEIAAIDGMPRSATVKSLGQGQLIRIGGSDFKDMVETSSDFAAWLVRRYARLVRNLTNRLYEQIAYDVATRILAELIRLAEEAGVVDNRAHIKPMPPHHVIATHCGTTREAVTRELNYLGHGKPKKGDKRASEKRAKTKKTEKREPLKLIEQRGREVVVHDFAALKRELKKRTTIP